MKHFLLLILFMQATLLFGQHKQVYVENGRLYHPNGKELALWGVNLQPNLSWEYNTLMKPLGIPWDANEWKRITDESLNELELMHCQVLRCHITPADFTDDKGNLVETIYLDLLDYMVAKAAERGIYSSFSFINHMGNWAIKNSFMNQGDKKKWITDPVIVTASKNYITQLLNRTNPYTKVEYKADTAITVWEMINEPEYNAYSETRKDVVLEYINSMYDVIRKTGDEHPIVWNCNWHRMINGNEDVFKAIAESKVEVVSFCNYPGQDLLKQPYYDNPEDLTNRNFSSWLKDCYQKRDWYGWTKDVAFKDKAKIVYEFETFYNQSAALYPAQAKLFRSLGVQQATMWHYSMPAYAKYNSGSHFLNLKCTPRKAASFIVASEIFSNVPLYDPYDTNSTTEMVTDSYMFSYGKDLSIYSSADKYYYSNSVSDGDYPKASPNVKHIIGYSNSPLVNYNGTGLYHVDILNGQTEIVIQPDAKWIREPWQKRNNMLVTELTSPNSQSFELKVGGTTGINPQLNDRAGKLKIYYYKPSTNLVIESDKPLKKVVIYNISGGLEYRNYYVNEAKLEINKVFKPGIYMIQTENYFTRKLVVTN